MARSAKNINSAKASGGVKKPKPEAYSDELIGSTAQERISIVGEPGTVYAEKVGNLEKPSQHHELYSSRLQKTVATQVLNEFPSGINQGKILDILFNKDINYEHVNAIKELTAFSDDVVADWFNVTEKTFRAYKRPDSKFKGNVKEQVVLLLSLIKHGIDVFGSSKNLHQWLETKNFFLNYKAPVCFLNTITGVKYIDDRLTAIEYGDNV